MALDVHMPRQFIESTVKGEVRCNDPSCASSQCGQCNKEQHRRKRKASQQKAAEAKAAQAEKDVEEAKREIAAGKKHEWTFDRAENDFGNGGAAPDTVARLLSDVQEGDELIARLEEQENAVPVRALERDSETDETKAHTKKKARMSDTGKVSTTWNHLTRCMFLKATAKYNPFGAAVKKVMWEKIALEMQKSTTYLKDTELGDFCVYTDGHGLQVFYERRRDDMDKKLAAESKTSGHGGYVRSKEECEEHTLMHACRNLEKDAASSKASKREHAKNMESLKNNEVNDAVIKAAQDDTVVQVKLLKVLQARVRQAKLEAKIWEGVECNKGMKYTFPSKALKDIEDLDNLKKKVDPEGKALDSSDAEVVSRTSGSLANAITSFTAKMPNMAAFTPVDPAVFAQKFFATKQQMTKTLQEKLAAVKAEFDNQNINETEKVEFEKQVKLAHFLNL